MERYARNPNVECKVCGKKIYKRPCEIKRSKGRVFCGMACYGKSCRKEKPCVVCGKKILAGLNKKTCNRVCANKHRAGIGYGKGSPKDKVKQHRSLRQVLFKKRGAKCQRCNYKKHKVILQIHHKDRNRKNNRQNNLEIICPNCHATEHLVK